MRIVFVLIMTTVGLATAQFSAQAAAAAPGGAAGLFGYSTRALGLGMVGLGMVVWSIQRRRSREEESDDGPEVD